MTDAAVATATTGERDREQETPVTLVDCDIHPEATSLAAWTSRLSLKSRGYFAKLEEGDVFPYHAGFAPRYARADAWPEEGPPGSSLELMREQHLDRYGIDYGILNLLVDYTYDSSRPEVAADTARALNEWLIETWLEPEPRLLATMIVPWEHPERAVREIEERAGDRWWAQVLAPGEALEPIGSRKYWPIYEAAAAHGLPIGMHVGGFDPYHATGWPSYYFETHANLSCAMRRQVQNLICEGLFDSVPGVRIVTSEGGVAWRASLRWALDSAFELLGGDVKLQRKPSEYLDEFVWCTTQPIEEPQDPAQLGQAIEHANLGERLMFSTDYPHWDFDSPTQALPRKLDKRIRDAILGGNAAELYGLPR